jgi:excisionase family DNA binding protein
VAELLGVSRTTSLKLVKELDGPFIGNKYGITFSKLDEFVASGKHISLS